MGIDWTAPLQTRDGKPVRLLETDGWQIATGDTRRRGWVCKYKNPRTEAEEKTGTTWLYYEDGTCRGDGAPSDNDLVNAAERAAA